MNIEGKLKSYRDLLVWQKSMALCQVAFVGLRVGKPAPTGGGFRPVQYRPKDSRVTLLESSYRSFRMRKDLWPSWRHKF